MNRGDVVRVELPEPKGAPGHEQFGLRPAIIVQIDNPDGANIATTIVVPLTSNPSAIRFPGSVLLKATPSNGLTVDSVALIAQVRAIDRGRIKAAIGKLSSDDIAVLENNLRLILGL
jgi:mRNA interferase MazF